MRWHRTSEDMLVCYHCGAFTGIPAACGACRAGVVRPAGTPGSQKLAEAVNVLLDRAGYPKQRIPILDSDLVHDREEASRQLAAFGAAEHPILVATAMIFSHRYDQKFDTVVIPSADMLISNPDFRTTDRLILQLEKIADLGPRRLVIQVHDDEGPVATVADRSWNDLYRTELAHRRSLRWPPFSRVIRLSISHRDRATASRLAGIGADRLTRAAAHLKFTGVRILGPVPALVEHGGGTWSHHVIIKHTLSAADIAVLLRHMPPGWSIDVDPRSIA